MRHREAVEHLPDWGTGSLDAVTTQALLSHAADCSACRDWIATLDVLVEAASPGDRGGGDHLDSDLLAQYLVRPEELHALDREEVRRHLRHCSTCSELLELTQAAVREARPGTEADVEAPAPERPWIPHRVQALAAVLAVLLVAAGLLLATTLALRLVPGTAVTDHEAALASRRDRLPEPVREVSRQDLEGTQLIHGTRSLVVSKLTVQSGADVTFHADDVVAFGDGFRVAEGARMRVGSLRAGTRSSGGDGNGRNETHEDP